MDELVDPDAEPLLAGAVLTALRAKGETADELRGFAPRLRELAMRPPFEPDLVAVDVVGTGGDGSGSLNLSTGSALVAAAAGVPVVKHGNRSVSSQSGSADVLAALGIEIPQDGESAAALFRRSGFTFLFAPAYHPAMKAVAPVRRALGIRTIFNLVGPLANPATPPLDLLDGLLPEQRVPVLLMGYYNPFLVYGLDRLADRMSHSGVAGVIVPDLPFEESAPMRETLTPFGLALVQLVTPTTPEDRLRRLAGSSTVFVYAVATTGVTGGTTELPGATLKYLSRVREASNVAVLAGFGIRSQSQVAALAPHVDGVVVGSALLEVIGRGDDPGRFIEGLRKDQVPA